MSDHPAVRRELVLDRRVEDAWPLIADPAELETWLADRVELDAVEEGARGWVTTHDGERKMVSVEEVEDGRRVAFSWCLPGGEPALVELTLFPEDDGACRLVTVEVPLHVLDAIRPAYVPTGMSRGPLAHA